MISMGSAGLFSSLFLKQDPALALAKAARANQSASNDDGDDSLQQSRRSTRSADDGVLAPYDRDGSRTEAGTENTVSAASLAYRRAERTTRLRISVQGDLNAYELAAIQSVVEQAGALANEFFAGGTAEAAALASSVELNPEQLDQVRLRLSLHERLTYSQVGTSPTTQPASPAGSGPLSK